ncbi:uncharacterized protein LOC129103257 [Anoplopoma fimbria]|uniref:uncharacterized protein LOC129103257 n=1 Tax=Anoplopoma fimbria TaxID=229290 RepID=UPI0023ED9684|nr:uncharacterized protein LOC129103257 [Anoplopoma fimbria]
MAEVRLRYGRGACNFAHKNCSRYLLESQFNQVNSSKQASALSTGFNVADIQSGELHGADTGGVSRDSYTRVTPVCSSVGSVWEVVAEDNYYLNKEYCLDEKPQVQHKERSLPLCRINATCRRTVWSAGRQQSLGLFWGQRQSVFVRAYSDNGKRSEPLYKTKTGYYEILQVSPTATQTQVKTAYYKQSFVYHPDRNAASKEATVRFSEISEAYTVLGNKALRKKYDRGLLSQSDLIATARPSSKDTGSSTRDQAGSRRSVAGVDTRGGVFDFDQFFRAHYGEQLQRDRDIRVRREEMLRKKQETIAEKKMGRMMEIGVAVLIAMALGIVSTLKR